MKKTLRLRLAAVIVAVIASGCSVTPPSQTTTAEPPPSEGRELTEIEDLLLKAETSPPPMAAEYTLLAAERLRDNGRLDQAASTLSRLDTSLLDSNRAFRLAMLQSDIELQRDFPQRALIFLNNLDESIILDTGRKLALEQQKLRVYQALEDQSGIARQLIALLPLLNDMEASVHRAELWATLQRLSDEELSAASAAPDNSYEAQGWYELARVPRQKDGELDLTHQRRKLNEWLTLWDMHSAAAALPDNLQQLQNTSLPGQQTRIALLLPLTGPLAKPAQAIREGFMAAYYDAQNKAQATPSVLVFDSNRYTDLRQFYDEALSQEVTYVVGPLDKDRVQSLESQAIPIPTLALNYTTTPGSLNTGDTSPTTNHLQLYQFGLSAEDEAQQVADRAWQAGHRVALSLTPDTSWGQRIQEAFADRWLSLGGLIAAQEAFTGENDFSAKISALLSIDQSQQRKGDLQRRLQTQLEFEPRRRRDVDFLFLTALPKDARQIKPTLAFHYASDLPVFATSHVFSGLLDVEKDQDLNGILFGDTPWLLNSASQLKTALSESRPDANSRFGRLYALGIDAFRLPPYLGLLQSMPNSFIQGETGILRLDGTGKISRGLTWAQFVEGAPLLGN